MVVEKAYSQTTYGWERNEIYKTFGTWGGISYRHCSLAPLFAPKYFKGQFHIVLLLAEIFEGVIPSFQKQHDFGIFSFEVFWGDKFKLYV